MAMHLEQRLIQLNQELENKKILLAVSGGVDSMVLLHALKHKSPVIVHVNHHKRASSYKDEELVASFCQQENLACVIEHLDIKKGNFQGEAHSLRQAIFLNIAHQYNLHYIMTAHHQDDHIETIIMRLLKGSSFEYLEGLKSRKVIDHITFYKPLLNMQKSELYEYAKTHQVPYIEDVSNQETVYERNKIRHEIIPALKQIDPDYETHLVEFSRRVRETSYQLKLQASFSVTHQLSKKRLLSLNTILQEEIIRLWLKRHHVIPSKIHVERVLKELQNSKPNVEIKLKDTLFIQLSYDAISIIHKNKDVVMSSIQVEHEGLFGDKHVSIFYDNKPNNTLPLIEICYNKLIFPLTVRYRQPGDTLRFHYGQKKLKDHLINIKYPKYLRDSLILIEDQSQHILYVENVYTNKTLGDTHTLWVCIRTHDDT